jgi:hypothetical protein
MHVLKIETKMQRICALYDDMLKRTAALVRPAGKMPMCMITEEQAHPSNIHLFSHQVTRPKLGAAGFE